jgi:uncharacterized membrane protein YkoI
MKRILRFAAGCLLVALALVGVACERGEGRDRREGNQATLSQQAQITREQASNAALAAVPGAVQRTWLERESGKIVYEVTVQAANGGPLMDVEVDATSGQVLKSLPTRADDDDDD